jgi:hypothetical protein
MFFTFSHALAIGTHEAGAASNLSTLIGTSAVCHRCRSEGEIVGAHIATLTSTSGISSGVFHFEIVSPVASGPVRSFLPVKIIPIIPANRS